jgi:hypothetical protein
MWVMGMCTDLSNRVSMESWWKFRLPSQALLEAVEMARACTRLEVHQVLARVPKHYTLLRRSALSMKISTCLRSALLGTIITDLNDCIFIAAGLKIVFLNDYSVSGNYLSGLVLVRFGYIKELCADERAILLCKHGRSPTECSPVWIEMNTCNSATVSCPRSRAIITHMTKSTNLIVTRAALFLPMS